MTFGLSSLTNDDPTPLVLSEHRVVRPGPTEQALPLHDNSL